jgi:tetratricopeptide (TPR) repeat protein
VLLIVFAAFFSPLYVIYKKSTVYDTWRHVFFIYPFWVTMAALAINLIGDWVKNPKWKWLPLGVTIVGLLPAIVWIVKSHPNQYVYFNELVGGIEGAAGYYDTDYYQNSGMQDAKWILKNVKPIPRKKIIVVSNMLGFDKYFAKDTSWLSTWYVRYNERHQKDWDYYVTYSRYIPPDQLQNDKWPPANVVYEVKVNGVVLSAVIKRKSKASIAAYDSLQAKNFKAAAENYAAYIQTDATDENVFVNYGIALASMGNIDGGIAALKKAVELESGNPQFYQILAQLYQIKGDKANAAQATNQANAIIMHEQELAQQGEE